MAFTIIDMENQQRDIDIKNDFTKHNISIPSEPWEALIQRSRMHRFVKSEYEESALLLFYVVDDSSVFEVWNQLMQSAREIGAVVYACGGCVVLASRAQQEKAYGPEIVQRIREMNGV